MSLDRDILNTARSAQEQVSVPPRQELSTQQKEWVRASINSLQAAAAGSRKQEDEPISQQRHPSHFGGQHNKYESYWPETAEGCE